MIPRCSSYAVDVLGQVVTQTRFRDYEVRDIAHAVAEETAAVRLIVLFSVPF